MASRMRWKPTSTTFNRETKIWSGKNDKPVFGPHDSIGTVVIAQLIKYPNHIAQICYPSGKKYTNQEIATLSIRVALSLQKMCLVQKDVIGLCAANSEFVAPLTFGALLCGLSISTLDPSFDKAGIAHVFAITRPKLMFCDGDIYDKVKSALVDSDLCNTRIYTVRNDIDSVPSLTQFMTAIVGENDFRAPLLEDRWNQVAMILCSSGTTGLPKGVTMSHASILNAKILHMLSTDKFLCFSTLYWLTGLITLIHGTINNTTRIISNRPYTPDDLIDLVERYKVNIVLSPPSQIAMALISDRIHTSDLSSIELYITGGSAVPYTLVKKFKKYATNAVFLTGYGMSEVCNIVAYHEIEQSNSVGKLGNNVEVKIIDNESSLLGINEIGEICIRTLHPWSGYYNNPEATRNIYDEESWIQSGDIGYFDSGGKLYIVDRKKDILKYNNFHFYPTAIEMVIMELPDVIDVCVVGIPDITFTHLPAAAIVITPQSNLNKENVCDHVAGRMQHFEQLIGGVYFFDNLPRTVSGKTLRRKVAEICANIYQKVDSI